MDRKLRMQIELHEAQLDRAKQRRDNELDKDRATIETSESLDDSVFWVFVIAALLIAILMGIYVALHHD
jgi:cytochrome c-type biogenesis protein CcmH/NrfG